MSVELKSKTSEAASKMLKNADSSDKLHSSGDTRNTLKSGVRYSGRYKPEAAQKLFG